MAVRRPTAAAGWARDPEDKQPFVCGAACLPDLSPISRAQRGTAMHPSFLPFSLLLLTSGRIATDSAVTV
jgi:hypothetical protein